LLIEERRLSIEERGLLIEERRLLIEDLRLSIEVRALQCLLGGGCYEEPADYQRISRKWSKSDSCAASGQGEMDVFLDRTDFATT
jgi:hypothetical protein